MIKFFRKIRYDLIGENKTGKYLKYAIGEIVLVIIGILIALQLNILNELRKQKLVEIDILEGIRNDILQDTIDINSNIRAYNINSNRYDFLLDNFINKKKQGKNTKSILLELTLSDRSLVLYDSHFQEAKSKGLSIISNKILKEKISRLYEWHYKMLIAGENSGEHFKTERMLNNELGKYFGLDSTGINISKSNYDRLLSDSNTLYHIKRGQILERDLLKRYQRSIEFALNVIESINKELIELKE